MKLEVKLMKESGFYNYRQIQNLIGISKRGAFKAIERLNKELDEQGYITLKGLVLVQYFNEKYKNKIERYLSE